VAAEVLAGAGPDRELRLVVLGFSQGAETASRWATYGTTRPAELVLWGGGLAADLDMGRARDSLLTVDLRFVVGADDRWGRERAEESIVRAREAGIEPDRISHPGGHRVEGEVLATFWAA
jgi:predicted esterase